MPDSTGEMTVRVPVGHAILEGDLAIPPRAKSIILFAHGSGSSRLSSRNKYVARYLQREGLATLLFDLLTSEEEQVDRYNARLRFDISLLASRLSGATAWVKAQNAMAKMTIGYFGASTGAAAALIAENDHQDVVKAIVSRGGRPDLAGRGLSVVSAPTLFIVGGEDYEVITLNEQAMTQVKAIKKMTIVPGATHLFGEPGALEAVADLASFWFKKYLSRGAFGASIINHPD
ncbi:MAG: hydrolase [Deltaproteobacteria bacterium HGW-Deltaproteobacteria-6]|nr:MAG: hydrolase [Deltaproteobacteria bacterium HGW-Deltaproteobacteria-6]